jgi:hypothetical protein
MSDTSPRNQRALQHDAPKAPPRQPKPGELLFEFHIARTHRFYRAESRDRGKWGVEAQIIEAPDDFLIGHRFPDRAQAARWAEVTRADLEAGYRETGD